MTKQIKWSFPENNDGPEEGLNDSGVETFKGSPVESLAREIIQNSLDALYKSNEPVRVVFELKDVNSNCFPGKREYIQSLESCRLYYGNNKKVKSFFNKALNLLNQNTIPVLKISDYNTTGLTGSKNVENSNWFGLIKSTGVSNKTGASGGSFGIGKNAPFACSDLRAVFYNTFDVEGVKAFQGVGKLATHKKGELKTRSTGYFGNSQGNNPIFSDELMGSKFYDNYLYGRECHGTDILIFGFTKGKNWQQKMIVSVLENFFVSIYQNMLEVVVDDVTINKDTLEDMLVQYTSNEKKYRSLMYYKAITMGRVFEKNNDEYDGLKLYLLEGRDLPKRVAMVRGKGMKIFDKGHFRGATRFIGVLIVEGNKANARLRELEPPSHDKWEAERAENVSTEKRCLKGLYDWIRKCVSDLIDTEDVDYLDFTGVGKFLPIDIEEESIGGIKEVKRETINREDQNIELEVHVRKKPKTLKVGNTSGNKEGDVSGNEGGNNSFLTNDERNEGHGKTNRSDSTNVGDEKEGEKDLLDGVVVTDKELDVNIRRSFMINEQLGEYRVTFTSEESQLGFFSIQIIGETSKEILEIVEAKTSYGEKIAINKYKNKLLIGLVILKRRKSDFIDFKFDKPVRYALDIDVFEGKR